MGNRKDSALCAKIAYGTGGLAMAAVVTLLPLLLPLADAVPISRVALAVAGGLGIALSVSLMPLAYMLVNGNTSIATGRYHLPFAVSMLVVAVCAVGIPCVGRMNAVGQGFILFGLFFALSLGMQIFAYTYFSIGRRFDASGVAIGYSRIFAYFSPVLGALAIGWLFDVDRVNLCGIMCLAALCTLIGPTCAYLATSTRMASFLRVEPFHRRTLSESYKRFFLPLTDSRARLHFVAVVLTAAGIALAVCTFPSAVFASRLGVGRGFKPAVMLMANACNVAGIVFSLVRRCAAKSDVASFASCLAAVAGAVLMTVLQVLSPSELLDAAATFVFAVLVGFAFGTAMPNIAQVKERVSAETGVSEGRVYTLFNCAVTVGIALGVGLAGVVACVRANDSKAAAVVSLTVFGVLFLAGAVMRFCLRRRGNTADEEKENG